MRLFCVSVALTVAWLTAAPATPVTAQAQAQATLFDDASLQDIHLFVNSRDLALVRARYELNTFYPADLVWNGQRVRNVGIRSRGAGSRNPTKLGLLIDFDRYTTDQSFHGFGSLVLDNLWQDRAMMREFLAMQVYRRMGHVAPREVMVRVFINQEYQGLYAAVEAIDAGFIARTFADGANAYIYEYRYTGPYFFGDLGDDLEPYKARFIAQTRLLQSDTELYDPLRTLVREINHPYDVVWRERVGEWMDLPQLMAHVAIQGCLGQADGLLGYAGINNFYLSRPVESSQHRLLPWDEDFAFEFHESSILRQPEERVELIDVALNEPDLWTVFLDTAEACARTIADEDWLLAEINRVAELVTPSVIADQRKQFSNDEFSEAVDLLRQFAETRSALVLAEVEALRRAGPAAAAAAAPAEPAASRGSPARRVVGQAVPRP